MHKRLALTDDAASIRVSWDSAQGTDAFPDQNDGGGHQVQWGFESGIYDQVVQADTTTYTSDDLCASPATDIGFIDPGFFHSAILSELPLGVEVFYRVGSGAFGWSDEASFVSPNAAKQSSRILLTADMGITYDDRSLYHWPCPRALATATHLIDFATAGLVGGPDPTLNWDAVLHIGDIAYGTGYATKWDRFVEMVEPVASRVPYMTCDGNHERDWAGSGASGPFEGQRDSGGECGVPTAARFIMPGVENNKAPAVKREQASTSSVTGAAGGWYSFDSGVVHVAMINTEFDLSENSDQHSWLASDLAGVDRLKTPWTLVAGHRQFYSCARRNAAIADALEPLLLEMRVDLVAVGHIHLAQRTCPITNGTCVEQADSYGYRAPVHAVVGNAGMTMSDCGPEGFLEGSWGSFDHGFASLTANFTNLELKFWADCESPGPRDEHCKDEPPKLIHEFFASMPYPRGY